MKTIGLLCGLSWVSTRIYYDIINSQVSRSLKDMNSAKIIMNSLNAQTVVSMLKNNQLSELESFLIQECLKLERSGCDFIAITCNTVHYFYSAIQDALSIPVVHIMESVSRSLFEKKIKKVGILATEFTVKNKLYDKYLNNFEIHSLYPNTFEVDQIDKAIFKICSSQPLSEKERNAIQRICERLKDNGAEAIILGCTELGFILNDRDDNLIINSAEIHAADLVKYSIGFEINQRINSLSSNFTGNHREIVCA